jgi:hypothetical protein
VMGDLVLVIQRLMEEGRWRMWVQSWILIDGVHCGMRGGLEGACYWWYVFLVVS